MLRGGNQARKIVSHHALENHFSAELVDLLGKVERIRIHAEGRQQLRPNRDNLSVHG
jgi:hypothetical protein